MHVGMIWLLTSKLRSSGVSSLRLLTPLHLRFEIKTTSSRFGYCRGGYREGAKGAIAPPPPLSLSFQHNTVGSSPLPPVQLQKRSVIMFVGVVTNNGCGY